MDANDFLNAHGLHQCRNTGCITPVAVCLLLALLLFGGCKTVTESQSTVDMHSMALLVERMDSMFRVSQTWQQSIYEKQQSLVDSFMQSEVRDTSRTVFIGAKGDTVKERIIIREYIEREHSTKESEKEYWEERFRKTDSLLQVSLAKQEKMDSTLQQRQKDTVIEKKAPWYERWWDSIKMVLFGIVVGVLAVFLFLRRNRKTP